MVKVTEGTAALEGAALPGQDPAPPRVGGTMTRARELFSSLAGVSEGWGP